MDIRIDTARYEARHGKPKGKRYWAFTIVSPSITTKDKYLRLDEPMTFQKVCERAKVVAELRRSALILLEPD